jgi:multiple sugar transport system permease protein
MSTTTAPALRREDAATKRRRRRLPGRPARRRELAAAVALLAPALVALTLFRLLPAWEAVVESLRQRDGALNLETYRFLFTTPEFTDMLKTTLVFNLLINPIQVVLALALAVLLTQRIPGTGLWRVVAFIPTALPIAVGAIVWRIFYRPDDGPINAVLTALGLSAQPFLTSQSQVVPSIILMACWVGVGYWMVFLIAGLQDIPKAYAEAAALDGAGWWRTFFHITLPLLRRPLAFVLIADTVVNFLMFAPIQVMTSGGPDGASNLIMFSAYQQAYNYDDQGLAAAQVVVVMAIMLVVVSVQFLLLRTKEPRR